MVQEMVRRSIRQEGGDGWKGVVGSLATLGTPGVGCRELEVEIELALVDWESEESGGDLIA